MNFDNPANIIKTSSYFTNKREHTVVKFFTINA